jgi:hypothetical protein
MMGPLGVLSEGPAAATTEVGDVDSGPLGVLSRFLTAATTDVKDVNGMLPERRRQSWRSGSAHQACYKPARV